MTTTMGYGPARRVHYREPQPYDYDHVAGPLWTGGMPLSTEEVEALAYQGIRHALNVASEYHLTAADRYRASGAMRYYHNPTEDDGRWQPTRWFATSAAMVLPALRRGEPVYVHCLCGSNRGPSTAYFLLRMLGWTREAAEKAVRRARPSARLLYIQDAEKAVASLSAAQGRNRRNPMGNVNSDLYRGPKGPADQPTIWDIAKARPTQPLTLEERYQAWRDTEAGQEVYAQTVARAYRLRANGVNRYGIGALVEAIRFDRAVQVGRDDEGYKVNNNYRSRLAREVMRREDDLDGFFETRRLRGY